MKTNDADIIINSVDRAIDIIEYLFATQKPVPLTQISKDLDLYKSTVYRTLVTLQNRGFVSQNQETGNYCLGLKLLTIGAHANPDIDIVSIAHPYMERLYRTFSETVNLSVLSHDSNHRYQSVVVDRINGQNRLSSSISLGSLNECYSCAVGKCLLAFTPNIDLSIYDTYPMVRHTKTTITTVPELEKELERVRHNRYALDAEEWEEGLFCIGAPILHNGVAVAAMSISGPTARINDSRVQHRIMFLRDLCQELSDELSSGKGQH